MVKAVRNAGSSCGKIPKAGRGARRAPGVDCGVRSVSRFRLTGHDQVDGFRTLALLVRLDIKADALAFIERLHSGTLDRRDVNENVTPTIIRLDETIATFAVEELDDSTLRHREAPFPQCCPA